MHRFLVAIDREWDGLARGEEARRRLSEWAVDRPALGGLRDLDELLTARRAPEAAPAILRALAELAPGDDLAARTLLQALVPGLVCLSAAAGYDDPKAIEELFALAWLRIRTYPAHRPGSVAANVLWDVRKAYRSHRTIEAPKSAPQPATGEGVAPSAEAQALDGLVLTDLVAVLRREGLSEATIRLILRTRIDGVSLSDVADEESVDVHAVTMRRHRGERRLRAAGIDVIWNRSVEGSCGLGVAG